MKIGVMVESFRVDFLEAVKKASSLGIVGIQKYTTHDYDMSDERVRELLDIAHSHGMEFSALCGDFGTGFGNEEANKETIEKSKRVLDLSLKFGCRIVTTHIGKIPPEECRLKEVMRSACRELATYADSVGATFAVETGTEKAQILADFLDSLGASGVRVNFDPANLVMCSGENAAEAVKILGPYIVHTHAKDGVMVGNFKSWRELPLGEGNVDFDKYLPALASTGFDGYLTIERECGDTPAEDIALAARFLKEKLTAFGL